MYENAAIVAAALMAYSALAGRMERFSLTSPIVFTAFGPLVGRTGVDVVRLAIPAEGVRLLAEASLATVLFSDAALANPETLKRHVGVPIRLLLIGLPLTIVLGFGAAYAIFPDVPMVELVLLAAILAPTDAALGAAVVTNPLVPAVLRESLSFESGLNDGICVPLVLVLLTYAVGTQSQHAAGLHIALVVIEELGIGAATGISLTFVTSALVRHAHRRGWTSEPWVDIPALGLAFCCFTTAQALGGSGFIACFVGGLVLSPLASTVKHEVLRGTETAGRILASLTWVVFGATILPWALPRLTAWSVVYALLSLTMIRMLPVFLCLHGTGLGPARKLFTGWFGPRGLASIVFAIIPLDGHLPNNELLMTVIVTTILLSVLLHGLTAGPLARRISQTETTP